MSNEDQDDTQPDGQVVTAEETEAAVERTRRQLIDEFARVMGDHNQRLLTSFNAALANFETTARSASGQEAEADILKVMTTVAFEEGVKAAGKELGEAGPAVGVILAFAKAIKQEIERAAAAATSHEVGNWIKDLRAAANDAFVVSGSTEALRRMASDALADASTEDDRQALVDTLTFATGAVQEGRWTVPSTGAYERALYERWINGHFTFIGRPEDDISGFVDIRFEDGDMPQSTSVVAPMGDKVGEALNRIASGAGLRSMMDLAVNKRVCKTADNAVGGSGLSCGWFDDRNVLINEPNSDLVTEFLKSTDWRSNVTRFR